MNRAWLVVGCAAIGCGSGPARDAKVADEICSRVGDRLEVRLRAHEADLPQLRSWAHADSRATLQHMLSPTMNDVAATHATALAVGPYCVRRDAAECATPILAFYLDDVDASFLRTRRLLDGMRGRGSCAPVDRRLRQRSSCDNARMHLEVLDDRELEVVREGWSNPLDRDGRPTRYASLAAEAMARWRALIDYGLALAPVCAPSAVSSCERLRVGLAEATPDDVAARVRALGRAFRDGTACPAVN